MAGSANQQLQTDSSNSSMSISPATSEVGSPKAIASSKCSTSLSRSSLKGLPFHLEKGIENPTSFSVGSCSKVGEPNGCNRRTRTSSYNSNSSGFSVGSKVGSRKELDRADLDFDWRSSSRLRSNSGSSEESKIKKSDDKAVVQVHRADQDLNWRDHDDPLSNSTAPLSSQISNWSSKKARRNKLTLGMT